METWEMRGNRPWAWWVLDHGEAPPPLEPGASEVRLGQLGELTEEECAALAQRAAEARAQIETGQQYYVATGQGRRLDFEREAIDLWARAREALRHPQRA